MLLQKTLHMAQPLSDCKSRLANIHSYRRQFVMVTRATITSSRTVDFSFRGPLGFEGHTVLLAVENDSPDELAFNRSAAISTCWELSILPKCVRIALRLRWRRITRL